MNIPIFKLKFEDEFIKKFRKYSEEIFTSNRPLSENKYVNKFENKFSDLVGSRYSIAVSSGTAAIEISLKALGVSGKSVILPSNTFFATSVAVTNAGAKIALVDVEEENFSMDPKELKKEIEKRLKNKDEVGAIIIVHVGGIISKHIKEIKKISDSYKIPLVEDAAQAHLSEYENLKAGTIGEIGCFSFFPTKVMTTGEGGMITTNNKKLYEKMISLKNFGRDNNNINKVINPGGNNFKVSELTGLMGYLESDRVLKRIKIRNRLAAIYIKRLKNSSYSPVVQFKGRTSHYKMILKTHIEREWLRAFCKKNNIVLTGEVYKIPIHKQPLYVKMFSNQSFPITDMISKNHICPPLYPELSSKEINYICDILLKAQHVYEK